MSRTPAPQSAPGGVYTLQEVPGLGIVHCAGNTMPTDGSAGYTIGCLFSHLDGADGSALYVNEGTAASCDFNLVTVAAA